MIIPDKLKTLEKKYDMIFWYPMRVTYSRELKMKQYLDELGVECFVPMRYVIVEKEGDFIRELVPAIHNLIFIHSSQNKITELKQVKKELEPLRYMMTSQHGENASEIITVPEKQMKDFIRVTGNYNERLMYLYYSNFIASQGRKIRIIGGEYVGVEGKILRIKKNKKVVIEIKGVAAVALEYVEKELMERIEN